MKSLRPDDVSMTLSHATDCHCNYLPVMGGETKVIDARCIAAYIVPDVDPGPCPVQAPVIKGSPPHLPCDLKAGHQGNHMSGLTRWWVP